MKRGTKLYLVSSAGETVGPYPWPIIRNFHGLGLIADNAWVCVVGEETWRALYDFPDLQTYPIGHQSVMAEFASAERNRRPATEIQHSYLRSLLCPFASGGLDFDLAVYVAERLAEVFPHLRNPRVEDEISPPPPPYVYWRDQPASEKQIAYLESIGEILRLGITKGEASDLIDRASDAQLRRLGFYGIRPTGVVTKQAASEMIDGYIRKHPDSEEKYQQWKRENGIR